MANVKRTPFAKKYNVLPKEEDKYDLFHRYGKSGFTPTAPLTIIPRTGNEIQHVAQIEASQKTFFYGFTARDLFDMGAFSDPEVKSTRNLTNPILPFLERHNWEYPNDPRSKTLNRAFFPIEAVGDCYTTPPDRFGDWHVKNPIVWDLLDPILRLTSRIFTCSLSSDFVDSFLCGEYRDVPLHLDHRTPQQKSERGPLRTFHRKPPGTINDSERQLKQKFLFDALTNKAVFGIGDGGCNPHTREPMSVLPGKNWAGVTQGYYQSHTYHLGMVNDVPVPTLAIDVQLSRQILQQLLRNDLNPSERLAEQWNIASVLVHEIMVGRAFETAVWGGIWWGLYGHRPIDHQNYSPHLGLALYNYPNRMENLLFEDRPLIGGIALVSNDIIYSPVLFKWYESTQKDEFWAAVRQMGIGLLRPTKAAQSISQFKDRYGNEVTGWAEIPEPNQDFILSFKRWEEEIRVLINMTPEERGIFAITRNLSKSSIRAAARRKHRQERVILAQEISKLLTTIRAAKEQQQEHFSPSQHQIIHIQHTSVHKESPLAPSNPGHKFQDFVTPHEGELAIEKNVNSAFIGTNLESVLREHGTQVLYVTGLTTDHCVSTTTRMAGNLGVCCDLEGQKGEVVLVQDATAAWKKSESGFEAGVVHAVNVESLREFATVTETREVVGLWESWLETKDGLK
ncbi:hypothetical protein G7Y89_g2498 [Cudoniella acicularis]|uniref:Isochorismatase-like domain-containing protein n=1 Tax=Cudoniella acicularis TaxID=354080 RepID=A0A8H4RV83_9HELO|nr:hypothetical protein G7Y89_g2498 [Cudoniella acicularis]